MNRDVSTGMFIGGMFVLFLAVAMFLPGNTITANTLQDSCRDGSCLELCDLERENTCSDEGRVCCFTHWSTGVCDFQVNCASVEEHSLHEPLEVYQDSVRRKPPIVDPSGLLVPLLVVVVVIGYFMYKRKNPFW